MTLNVANLPPEIREGSCFVGWRYESRSGGEKTKVPVNPRTGNRASSTDPTTWSDLQTVLSAIDRFHLEGAGRVVTVEDKYAGIDLDHCLDPSGKLTPEAESIVKTLDSYTEITPSGTGVRIWTEAKLPAGHGCKKRLGKIAVEIYDRDRFFTLTGNHLPGTRYTVEQRQRELEEIYSVLFDDTSTRTRPSVAQATAPTATVGLQEAFTDAELIDRAADAVNSEKFLALMAGDTSLHGGDESSADLALCCMIAFWTRSAGQIDRIFRTSKLYRPKWDSNRPSGTYGSITILRALGKVQEWFGKSSAPQVADALEGITTMALDAMVPNDMNWLWPDRIPAGYLSVFSGNPDTGKTTIALDLVARYTTGREWPDGTPNALKPGYVLLMIAEDGAEDVILPRLIAAGADRHFIHIMKNKVPTGSKKDRYFALDQDLEKLERRIKEPPFFSLVIADPLSSYLGKSDMNKEQEVRKVLGPIKEMCERTGVTFWGLGHFNKRSDVSALGAVSGAVANTGLPRAVFLCMKDPRGEQGDMLMLLGKGNLTRRRTGLRYRFREEKVTCGNGKPNFVPVIEWRGEETEDADSVNETARNPDIKGRLRAEHFLQEYLKDDEKPSAEIFAAAKKVGLKERTLYTVKKDLGIRAVKRQGVWWWQSLGDSDGESEKSDCEGMIQ